MNELELTRALYLQLAEQDQRLVVKKAAEKGFVVDGFSKNVSKAPPRAVCACMAKRARRGKYPYQFILSAMAEQQKVDEENIIYYLAGEWMKGEYTHAGVEEDLKKLIHNKKESDNTIKDNEKSQKDLQNQECKYKEESEVESAALKKELERLDQELLITKDKTKKYKNTIQEYKIEIDNLQKNILREEKAKDRLFRQIGELENELEKVQEEKNEEIRKQKIREYEIRELQNQVETLMQQIKDLEIYRRHAPKLLCIVKSKNKIEIPGYDIKMAHEWNEVIREEAVNGEYFEVWLVQKQFPYHLVNEISECIGKKLKQFLTVEDLMNTVSQGGKKDDAN